MEPMDFHWGPSQPSRESIKGFIDLFPLPGPSSAPHAANRSSKKLFKAITVSTITLDGVCRRVESFETISVRVPRPPAGWWLSSSFAYHYRAEG